MKLYSSYCSTILLFFSSNFCSIICNDYIFNSFNMNVFKYDDYTTVNYIIIANELFIITLACNDYEMKLEQFGKNFL